MSRPLIDLQQSIYHTLNEGDNCDCDKEVPEGPEEEVNEAFFQTVSDGDLRFKITALIGQSDIITKLYVKNIGNRDVFKIPLQSYPAIYKAVSQGSSKPDLTYRIEELAFGNKKYPVFFSPSGLMYGRGKPEKEVPAKESRYHLTYIGPYTKSQHEIIHNAAKKPLIDNSD